MEKTIQLKNYQKKALHEINVNYANGTKSQLLVMATGTGKTVVFCEFIKELISVEKKVLILVHRDELINQAERRLKLHTSEPFGIEKAERKANNENIVLASVQTLKGKRLKKFATDYFDVIIIDECHRSTANSYMAVRNHFKKSHVLGVTATPERQDDLKITKKHFQKIAFTYNLLDAIKEGNLANIRVWRVESEQDISDVKSNSDDLDQKALAKVLDNDEYLEFIYKTITEKAFNKKIMVFMPSVKMSDKLADLLNSKGLSAFSVNSNTPLEKRQEVLEDYKTGKIKVLSNYNIFTEGFDEPSIDCVIMARPTKSEIFYSQALGRMTRLFEGKKYGMLIDIGFINGNLKLASIFDLVKIDKAHIPYVKDAIKNLKGTDLVNVYIELIDYINSLPKQNKPIHNKLGNDGQLKFVNYSIDVLMGKHAKNKLQNYSIDYLYKEYLKSIKEIENISECSIEIIDKEKKAYKITRSFINLNEFTKLLKMLHKENKYLNFLFITQRYCYYDYVNFPDKDNKNFFKMFGTYFPLTKTTFKHKLDFIKISSKHKSIGNESYLRRLSIEKIQKDITRETNVNKNDDRHLKGLKHTLEGFILLENFKKKFNIIDLKSFDDLLNIAKEYKIKLNKNTRESVKKVNDDIARKKEEQEKSLMEVMRKLVL